MLDIALRVAVDRSAYAELIAHAKESLDAEICGVLAGNVCEDDEGVFVDIKAIIRGSAAEQGSTHVTYTQETWSAIHKTMEEEYPRMQIVGWYHSHPGYGVEFSDMDIFIQKNFFSNATQIGLVIDPLGGDVGICVNADQGIKHIERFWVDGREQRCRVPPVSEKAASSDAQTGEEQSRLASVEHRLDQAIRALDDLRGTIHRYAMSTAMMVAAGVIVAIGYFVYTNYFRAMRPPEVKPIGWVPVKIGDKTSLVTIGILSWEVPPELLPKPQESEEGKPSSEVQPEPGNQSTPSQPSQSEHSSQRSEGGDGASNKNSTPAAKQTP
ncbi:MAG TPA: Mov34/MPN/PAD-1 family protein [Blastocatellia bacterium]|nr:Mov34/MPN/PAD-1 family protein [Blastocatellia bacterium]